MRIGTSTAAVGILFAGAVLAALGTPADGQMPGYGSPGGVYPAVHNAADYPRGRASRIGATMDNYMTADGGPVILPAGYNYCGGGECGPGMGCGMCGGLGCACCQAGGGPYPPGGPFGDACGMDPACNLYGGGGADQCGPHYFDLSAEAVFLQRSEIFDRQVDFTSINIAGPIVLSSSDLDSGYQPGFRLMGRYDLGALSLFEVGYTGVFDFDDSASAVDPSPVSPTQGNLYSLFSEFGTNPPGGVGMDETEQAVRQSINWESDLQTVEMSIRRYWVGYNPRVTGTLLAGFRYTWLDEKFQYDSIANGEFLYQTDTSNSLLGAQLGGDVWVCIRQGIRLGAEGKAGIYNNHYKLDTLVGTDDALLVDEYFEGDEVAFIGESRVTLVADLLPNLSFKAGYEVLWLNSIVNAGDNFNTASPYGLPGQEPRVPFVDNQGDAFYHGGNIGLEYVW